MTGQENNRFDEEKHPRGPDGKFGSGGATDIAAVSEAAKKLEFDNGGQVHSVSEGKGTAEFFHGSFRKAPELHVGQTFADNRDTAENYSSKKMFTGTVDMEGLAIARVSDFNRDEANYGAIGDSEKDIQKLQDAGVDIIHYEDEDPNQRQHTSFRIVSQKALDRFKETMELEED